MNVKNRLNYAISRQLHRYADWRIGATLAEKHCYKSSDSVLFTFDDFGSQKQVNDILTILKNKNVKAMFFLQSEWAISNNDLLKAIKRDGHIIGNHTLTHPNLLKLKDDSVNYEIENGLPGPWLRAPEGRYNNRIRKIAKNLGYSMCYWSIDSCDWKGSTVKEMRHTILSELHPGAVILFHIHGHHTISLLPDLIDDIRLRGYELTSHKENWQPAVDQLEPVDMLSSQI